MPVERQARPHQGEWARHYRREGARAVKLGQAFGLAVSAARAHWIGSAPVVFGQLWQIGRLLAVDGARADEEEPTHPEPRCEIENAASAVDDDAGHLQGLLFVQARTGRSGGMDHVRERAFRPGGRAHVGVKELDVPVGGQMRSRLSQCGSVSGEHDGPRIEPEACIGMGERFHQPAAEKSGPPGDEHARSAQLFPERPLRIDDLFQLVEWIGRRQATTGSDFDARRARTKARISSATKERIGPVRPG